VRSRIELAVTTALTIAAIVIAASLVRREFFPRPASALPTQEDRITYVAQWRPLLAAGIHVGPSDAPIKIVEFSDLECAFCKRFHETMTTARSRFADTVSYTFLHFPLSPHRFARPAARAAECADDQNAFMPFIDLVFRKQDSLGLKSWTSYADEAGVPDTAQFGICTRRTDSVPRIEEGRALGRRIGVTGTPTILVNGWRLPRVPSDSQLLRIVSDILAGRKPRELSSPD
jgi:protein-disulfide isomerase